MANSATRKLLVLVQRRCVRTSAALPPPPPSLPPLTEASNFTVQFLINSCGLSSKSAISFSEKFQLQEKNHGKHLSIIDFFKAEGFTQIQIAKLIKKWPRLLHCKVEANLKPKLEFLKENGFVGELLTQLVVTNPSVVKRSLGHHLEPCLELIRSYLKSDEKIVFATRRWSLLLTCGVKCTLRPNIDLLIKEGVQDSSIAKLITSNPRVITKQHCRVIYSVNAVKKLGFHPSSSMFLRAFRIMMSLSKSTWKKKMEVMQSLGWSEEEILSIFKREPYVMGCSEGNIRKSMDFYLNVVKLDRQTIIKNPKLLMFAIDTRARPRYIILKILESRRLTKKDAKIAWFDLSEKEFLEKFVIKHEVTIPGLMEIYITSRKAEKVGTCRKEESSLLQVSGVCSSQP